MANPLNLPENPEDGICIACLSNPHKEDCDIGKAWKMIEDSAEIISYIAKCEGDVPPAIYAAADKWLQKYNEVT